MCNDIPSSNGQQNYEVMDKWNMDILDTSQFLREWELKEETPAF